MTGRPTCSTCPFWSNDNGRSECRYLSPGERTMQPQPDAGYWCGRHPDFPQYMRDSRPRPSPKKAP